MFHILTCKYNQFNFCGFLIYAEESQGSKTTSLLKTIHIQNWEDKLGTSMLFRTYKYTTHEGEENHALHTQASVYPISIKQIFREVLGKKWGEKKENDYAP